jgi:preprotein translocase subunit SecE
MAKTNPFEFVQQVRSEVAKVTWPTLNETVVTTIMVILLAAVAAVFFLSADLLMGWGMGKVLQLPQYLHWS